MSIALWVKVEALEKRLEALERAHAAAVDPLRERNARRKTDGARLREMIRESGETNAKRALQALGRAGVAPLPALRTVQWHLRAIRNTTALR
jgi:hypothetical protein